MKKIYQVPTAHIVAISPKLSINAGSDPYIKVRNDITVNGSNLAIKRGGKFYRTLDDDMDY